MGTDITLYVEKKVGERWYAVKKLKEGTQLITSNDEKDIFSLSWPYCDRDYRMFSILADVRNRFDIVPISPPRGAPKDLSPELNELIDEEYTESLSYHTLADLNNYNWNQTERVRGMVGLEQYKMFKQQGKPNGFCFFEVGSKQVSNKVMDAVLNGKEVVPVGKTYYTEISWMITLRESSQNFFDVLDLEKLSEDGIGEDVRIVFYFDS